MCEADADYERKKGPRWAAMEAIPADDIKLLASEAPGEFGFVRMVVRGLRDGNASGRSIEPLLLYALNYPHKFSDQAVVIANRAAASVRDALIAANVGADP